MCDQNLGISGQTAEYQPQSKGRSFRDRIRDRGWNAGRHQLRCFLARLSCIWCIWRSAFCSFRGHIQTQRARGIPGVDFGPALQSLPDGSYQPNTRTIARSEYTRKLQATLPWVDSADVSLYLMGFDMGEQWALHTDNEEKDSFEDS